MVLRFSTLGTVLERQPYEVPLQWPDYTRETLMAPRGAPSAERTERRISEPLSWSRWRVPTPGVSPYPAVLPVSTSTYGLTPLTPVCRVLLGGLLYMVGCRYAEQVCTGGHFPVLSELTCNARSPDESVRPGFPSVPRTRREVLEVAAGGGTPLTLVLRTDLS